MKLRTLLNRFIDEVINGPDLDAAVTELVIEDFVEQNPLPGQGPGRAGLADVLTRIVAGFPNLYWTIHETVVEGDRIMAYSSWTATHNGEFLGIPATGHQVTVEAWTLDRYRDGQMIESRILMDVAGLLIQLGVLPAPGTNSAVVLVHRRSDQGEHRSTNRERPWRARPITGHIADVRVAVRG